VKEVEAKLKELQKMFEGLQDDVAGENFWRQVIRLGFATGHELILTHLVATRRAYRLAFRNM
jgi:hypothetical protein